MDDKARTGARNWDISEQTVGVTFPCGANERQASFLKMNMYYNRNSIVHETEAEGSVVEFDNHVWVHQRNFLSAMKKNQDPVQSTQINTETGFPAIPITMFMPTGGPSQNQELGTTSSKIRNKSSMKKSNNDASKALRLKQHKKQSAVSTKEGSISTAKQNRNLDVNIDGTTVDFSQTPVPICSCTGIFRQCYRWGAGGWQSSCCTTGISEYPLPMSSSRPGARVAGRKMSNGAYGKLLQRLAAEGYDFSNAVDLKHHWAKHGTNKFVTIK